MESSDFIRGSYVLLLIIAFVRTVARAKRYSLMAHNGHADFLNKQTNKNDFDDMTNRIISRLHSETAAMLVNQTSPAVRVHMNAVVELSISIPINVHYCWPC